ncbi:MAG: dockerin type I repeat-containing protein [Clostridia bacterium]|nr:dockerin type I repeat-containing protein [Clostridia bacterium]
MKRILSIFIAVILLFPAFPGTAFAAVSEPHILEADQVLIYNPLPCEGDALFTGTLSSRQDQDLTPGDALFTSGMHETGKDRSTGTKDPDTRDFWVCTDLTTYQYDKCTFRLAAEGEHCRIWTRENDYASFAAEQAQSMLEQFETVIYPADTASFGPFRELGDGKLEIVTYAMNSSSVCGFFDSYDLYTREEIEVIDPDDADSYNCLPIINVNARMADHANVVYGTLAHEFQHLILRSAVLASPANAGLPGKERTIGVWLNEGFSMAAEEFCYPGSVAEQGYLEAFANSDKVRIGLSYRDFDATASDVGAYGQSFLFADYLKTQCGAAVFKGVLDYWRGADALSELTEANAIQASLSASQILALDSLCDYTAQVSDALGSEEEILLSKFALAFRIAILLHESDGLFAIGAETSVPYYTGSGRRIAGGGALYVAANGSFTVPMDADAGLVFVGIRDGSVTEIHTVPEPEEGYYLIAVQFGEAWYAMSGEPDENAILKAVPLLMKNDGSIDVSRTTGCIFRASRTEDGFRFTNDSFMLSRTDANAQTLSLSAQSGAFRWSHFADGSDKLQGDGYYGRAILYGDYQHGFGYFPSGFFENASFAKPQMIRVNILRGDANLDGKVTAADAAIVLRTLVGLSSMNEPMRDAADVNGDGTVTAADAAFILRIVVQIDS